MAVPIQNCCVVFNLRQGSVIIAVIELFLSAVALFLLALGLSHAQDVAALLAADMEESAIHEEETTALLYAASTDGLGFSPPHSRNEEHLLRAQQLATVVIISMYIAMALAAVKLVSSVLLLYGSLMRRRRYLLPWVSIVLIQMVFCFSALVVCLAFSSGHHVTVFFAVGIIKLMITFYLWLAVFSYYRQVYEDEVIGGSIREVTTASAMKTGYLQFSNKPYNV